MVSCRTQERKRLVSKQGAFRMDHDGMNFDHALLPVMILRMHAAAKPKLLETIHRVDGRGQGTYVEEAYGRNLQNF